MWARTSSLHLGWTNCLFVLVLIYLLESYVRAFMCICSFSRKNPPNVHHASGKFNSNFLAYFVCTLIINSMYFKCLSNFIRRCNLWHNFWDFFFWNNVCNFGSDVHSQKLNLIFASDYLLFVELYFIKKQISILNSQCIYANVVKYKSFNVFAFQVLHRFQQNIGKLKLDTCKFGIFPRIICDLRWILNELW